MRRIEFRRRRRPTPMLNMAAMPDLIFTVLFFFMIVTHMREHNPLLRTQVPQGKELSGQGQKSTLLYVYMGTALSAQQAQADSTLVEVGGALCAVGDVARRIDSLHRQMSDDARSRLTVVIKADKKTPVSQVAAVKQQLQQAGVRRISYAASPSQE